jgi:hypothetical protein
MDTRRALSPRTLLRKLRTTALAGRHRWRALVAVASLAVVILGGAVAIAQSEGEQVIRDMNSLLRDLQLVIA